MTARTARLALLCGVALICESLVAQIVPDVNRILADPDSMYRVQAVRWTAAGDFFDTAQTLVAGTRGRHVSSYDVDVEWEPADNAELRWRLHTHYPFASEWLFSETVAAGTASGRFTGVDGFRPTPEGPLPQARAAARTKQLWMSVPSLLLAEAGDLQRIEGQPNVVAFSALDTRWRLQLDVESGLPIRISTTEDDPLFGTVDVSVEYSNWTEIDSVFIPARLEYRIDGELMRRERRAGFFFELEQHGVPGRFVPPLEASRYAKGWRSSHWFISRIALGAPADQDESRPVELLEVAEGIYQVLGSSHHSLVIEGVAELAVVDAPLYPERSEAILETLRTRWPLKPVRRLILTHHHFDHSGGVVTFAKAGIPITVPAASRDFFASALARQGTGAARLESVSEAAELRIGDRRIGIFDIPTSHAVGVLAVHIPDQALLFNSDLYSPGRERQHPLWASELLTAIEFLGLQIERHVGAHGRGVQPAEHLQRLVAGEH